MEKLVKHASIIVWQLLYDGFRTDGRGRASGNYRGGRQDEDHANAAPAGAIRFAPVAGIHHAGAGRKDVGRSSLRLKLPVPAFPSSGERRCTRTWVEQRIPE